MSEIITRLFERTPPHTGLSDMTGSGPQPARKPCAAGIVVGGSYIINKQTLSIQQNGDGRDLRMLPADSIVVVEALSPTELLVTVSHNGLSCFVFAQDLIERGALVGIRVETEVLAMVASGR